MRQDIERIRRVVLSNDDIPEFEMLFLQERFQRGKMLFREKLKSGRTPHDLEVLCFHPWTLPPCRRGSI